MSDEKKPNNEPCDHLLDFEETHCVKCNKPVWLIDNSDIPERVAELEKKVKNNASNIANEVMRLDTSIGKTGNAYFKLEGELAEQGTLIGHAFTAIAELKVMIEDEQINNDRLHFRIEKVESVLKDFKQLVFEELNDDRGYDNYLEKFLKIFDRLGGEKKTVNAKYMTTGENGLQPYTSKDQEIYEKYYKQDSTPPRKSFEEIMAMTKDEFEDFQKKQKEEHEKEQSDEEDILTTDIKRMNEYNSRHDDKYELCWKKQSEIILSRDEIQEWISILASGKRHWRKDQDNTRMIDPYDRCKFLVPILEKKLRETEEKKQ